MGEGPIIVFRIGSLGDTIFALPCFHAIRRVYAGREIIVLTNFPVESKAAPLMAVLGDDGQFVDSVIEYPLSLRNLRELVSVARSIRASKTRTLIYLMPLRSRWKVWRDWLFLRIAGGVRQVRCLPVGGERVDAKTGEVEREAARLIRSCASLGPIDIEDRSNWDLMLTDSEYARANEVIAPLADRPFIAVNMGGKVAKNDWGEANWGKLRDLFAARGAIGLLVIGAEEDRVRADAFISAWAGIGVNACGRLAPRESGAAVAGARLFIGHDSGPLHLAAAIGVPCIGLYGDNNPPKRWHPVGAHVSIIHRMEGVDRIAPDEVMELAEAKLAEAAG